MSNVFSEPMALKMAIAMVVPGLLAKRWRDDPEVSGPVDASCLEDLVLDLTHRGVVEDEDDAGGLPDRGPRSR